MSALRHNGEIAREYLRAIEAGETGDNLARFFDPEVMLEEFPNRLSPQGRRSGLAQALEAAERGQKLLASHSYEIHSVIENGERLALEVTWIGTLKIPGPESAGRFPNARSLCGVPGISERQNCGAAKLRLFRSLVTRTI
jgi:hypothetical protein